MFRYDRPVSQSSLISLRPAETGLSSDASLGKSVATRVRRLISLLSRSRPLLVRSLRRWPGGKPKTVMASGTLTSSQPGHGYDEASYREGTAGSQII